MEGKGDGRLPAALIVWAAALTVTTLGFWRISELTPQSLMGALTVGVYLLLPVAVIAVCIWSGSRGRRWAWAGAALVLIAHIGIVMNVERLLYAAAYLNFLAHKPTYDRIVADAKAGRLPLDGRAWSIRRTRGGVRYFASAQSGALELEFPWNNEAPSIFPSFYGAVYDEADCPRPPPPPPEPQPPPAAADADAPPQMKHGGKMGDSHHLAGHYCFLSFVS